MRYTYTGKNVTITDALKERTENKLGRLEKLLPGDVEVRVTFSNVKLENKVEVTIPLHRRVLRAETSTMDMYQSIDEIVDILEKQMVKYKTRLKGRSRKEGTYREELMLNFPIAEADTFDANEIVIEKNKRFELKPMDAEEAVMEMELLGHSFYVFRNERTDAVNVVYKRKQGSYGLIEPEF